MKSFKEHITDNTFEEYTVSLYWENLDSWKAGTAEVMVHVNSEGKILLAYSYAKDIKDMPKKYLGKMSKNPLFQNLTPEFIYDYKKEIDEQIGEEIRNEKH